jgi:hypothetical protein
MGDRQLPVASRIKHIDLAVGYGDVVGVLEGSTGLGHGTWIGVGSGRAGQLLHVPAASKSHAAILKGRCI